MDRRCELCGRQVPRLTRHHLVPRARHAKLRNRKSLSREELQRVATLCRPCHKQIHSLLAERELGERYNSVEALRAHPEVAKFVDWIRDKPADLTVRSYRAGWRNRR